MNRDEHEMAFWREAYWACRVTAPNYRAMEAGEAVAEFRKRYPPQSEAPPAVWYDEPPFPKDGKSYPCWVTGAKLPAAVYFNRDAWYVMLFSELYPPRLNGRRVCPIIKPPEPTT